MRPDVIHFDEVYMEASDLSKRKSFSISQLELKLFLKYLSDKSYKNITSINNVIEFDKQADIWSEFILFKYESTRIFISEIVQYVKTKSNNTVLVSGNFSPSSWFGIKISNYFDYIVSEIPHRAKSSKISYIPLYVYKMANGINKKLVSTALGSDWNIIKQKNYTNMVSSWIAQAYALDQYMNFPLKAWVPGSSYVPDTLEYSNLSGWIKGNTDLFDDYNLINTVALIVDEEVFLNYKQREKFKNYISNLINSGVLFKVILDSNKLSHVQLKKEIDEYSSILIPFNEYIDKNKNEVIYRNNRRVYEGFLSGPELRRNKNLSTIEFTSGESIYSFPKKNIKNSNKYLIHLLNRDFNSVENKMNAYSDIVLKINHSVIGSAAINQVFMNQPKLVNNTLSKQNTKENISHYINNGYVYFKIPYIYLWGILEIETNL